MDFLSSRTATATRTTTTVENRDSSKCTSMFQIKLNFIKYVIYAHRLRTYIFRNLADEPMCVRLYILNSQKCEANDVDAQVSV